MNKTYVGEGKVRLVASPKTGLTSLAGRICRSTKDIDTLLATEGSAKIIETILNSGHLAATEFDYYVFAVEGFSRVTEVQLVRKRMASYIISSGRENREGKTPFNIVYPKVLDKLSTRVNIPGVDKEVEITPGILANITEQFYNKGVEEGFNEEDLRYFKPQATSFKGLIGMDAHALLEFFNRRCCVRAQAEIRDLAFKMLALCKQVDPILFAKAGAPCKSLGYCIEDEKPGYCKVPTKKDVNKFIKAWKEASDTEAFMLSFKK